MKRFMIMVVIAVVAGGALGGAFIGGVAVGKGQGQEAAQQELLGRAGQFATRFGSAPGGTQNDGTQQQGITAPAGAGALFGRGGTVGTVQKVEGSVITISSFQGSTVLILTSGATTVQKTGAGSLSDIKTGESITVTGERKDDGSIRATAISIMPATAVAVPVP